MDMLEQQFNKLTPIAPPEDAMRPWRTPSPRNRYRLHHRCRWTEFAKQLMVPCWAKHCADPAPDRHTALRRFPKRKTQGVVSPTGRECQFLRGARIPHAVCENTTRGGPRKSPLSRAMCKKCPAWRQGLVKIRHGGHLSRGKANNSRMGGKMSESVPRAGRQSSGKQL